MHSNYILILAALASSINALPLNINLGAYSPALVVGDGEISFGGKQDVSNLMNALQGAAVAGGAANGAAAPATAPAAGQPAAEAAVVQAAPAESSTQITALQGMGKEIAPRVVNLSKKRRDLAGFNAALKFATDAIKISPEVQLGTGEGGAGVGIIQKAGGSGSPAKAAIVARQEGATPKTRTTVTTMFVRGGVAPAARSESSAGTAAVVEKRAPAPGVIDGVNLNMAEGQVAELTFVETRAVDEAEVEDEEDEE